MIDVHIHLLPGVDDGPATLDVSLRMAEKLVADGVRTAVATPHVRTQAPSADPASLAERVADLSGALERNGIALEVLAGAEVELVWALDAGDDALAQASIGQRGTDLLVETPFVALPAAFDSVVLGLAARGYRVILAHPERNSSYQHQPGRVAGLVRAGVLVQITAGTLLRRSRAPSVQTARRLLTHGLVHAVASDAHTAEGFRGPTLARAAPAIEGLLGTGAVEWLLDAAPRAIVEGRVPPPRPQQRPAWRRTLDRFRS